MSQSTTKRRVYFLANPDKAEAASAMQEMLKLATSCCDVVGSVVGLDGHGAADVKADRIVIFGGDGTLIGVARSLEDKQIPLIGVNVGKLGYLTEFSLHELKTQFEQLIHDDKLIEHRAALQVTIERNGGVCDSHIAINDCVIQAGSPFRIINLGVSINGEHLTDVGGDGIIVCTPSGSTAHNLSAGGPILQPGLDAIILTPVNSHSLTHKPLVVERNSVITIQANQVNEGTTAMVDGQVASPLKLGDRVIIQRYESDFLVVRNSQSSTWNKLINKLHWGRAPDLDKSA